MAQYQVTYACGHTGTEALFGPTADRTRKIKWIGEHKDCPACYKAAKAAEVAKKVEATADMPALTGSEKQIAWATTIRAEFSAKLTVAAEAFKARINSGPDHQREPSLTLLAGVVHDLMSPVEARHWIDHRDRDAGMALQQACREAALRAVQK